MPQLIKDDTDTTTTLCGVCLRHKFMQDIWKQMGKDGEVPTCIFEPGQLRETKDEKKGKIRFSCGAYLTEVDAYQKVKIGSVDRQIPLQRVKDPARHTVIPLDRERLRLQQRRNDIRNSYTGKSRKQLKREEKARRRQLEAEQKKRMVIYMKEGVGLDEHILQPGDPNLTGQ